jgi:hypothetical protein
VTFKQITLSLLGASKEGNKPNSKYPLLKPKYGYIAPIAGRTTVGAKPTNLLITRRALARIATTPTEMMSMMGPLT